MPQSIISSAIIPSQIISSGVQLTQMQHGGAAAPLPVVSVALAAATPLLVDAFSEANGTELNGKAADTDYNGYGWFSKAGTFDIQSGQAHCITTDRWAICNLPSPNFTMTVTVTPESTTANTAVAVRFSNFQNTFYVRWRQSGTNAIQIIEIANNSTNIRATAAKTPGAAGETYTIVITCNGNTISATVGGTTATYTTSFNQYVANCGLYGLAGALYDNLSVVSIAESIPSMPNFAATNAAAVLTTPTYDTSGEAMHPDVVYNAAGWNGYKYWMAMTPNPGDTSSLENPSILASNDLNTWVVPAGLINPVIAYPGGTNYNSDPDLCFSADGLTLYMIYRQVVVATATIYVVSTTDGITWSGPTSIFSGPTASILSPSFFYDGTQFVLYYVDATVGSFAANGPYRFRLMRTTTATDPTAAWATPIPCNFFLPTRDLWHLNVIKGTSDYILLATVAGLASATGNPSYFHVATSLDGFNFRASAQVMGPSASAWDNNAIYRSSALQLTASSFDLFYSARSSTAHWHTGRVTMTRA